MILYYAIRNKRTMQYISGTDFNYSPPRQIKASALRPPKLLTGAELNFEIKHRQINLKYYEIVTVRIKEIEA